MIHHVLRAPVNLYFDTTPIGRILNRFSKDLQELESGFSVLLGSLVAMAFSLLYVIVVAIFALYWIALLLPVIAFMSVKILKQSSSAIRESIRLTSTTKSPLLSYLGETINGSSTIRAFGKSNEFKEGSIKLLNQNILATQFQSAIICWFTIRVNLFSFSLMMVMDILAVLMRDTTSPIILCMLVTSVLTINDCLISMLRFSMMVQGKMVSVVRCIKLMNIPQEK